MERQLEERLSALRAVVTAGDQAINPVEEQFVQSGTSDSLEDSSTALTAHGEALIWACQLCNHIEGQLAVTPEKERPRWRVIIEAVQDIAPYTAARNAQVRKLWGRCQREYVLAARRKRPKPKACVFARLPDGRFDLQFGEEAETLRGYKGLQVIAFLLRQRGKAATALEVSRATEGREKPRCLELEEIDGDRENYGYSRDDKRPLEPLDAEGIRSLEARESELKEWAEQAESKGQGEKARQYAAELLSIQAEIKKQRGLRKQAKRGRSAQNSPDERARKRIWAAVRDAYARLDGAGLAEMRRHFEDQKRIVIERERCVYVPDPEVSWQFDRRDS
jgi:hypothetical protein